MRAPEIAKQIEDAIADERRSHRLRAHLQRAAKTYGELPTREGLDETVQRVVDYVREVPVLLESVRDAAKRSRVHAWIDPLLDACEGYWFSAKDRGLVGYLDVAYYVLSLLREIAGRSHLEESSPGMEDPRARDREMRALIGEHRASELDASIGIALISDSFPALLRNAREAWEAQHSTGSAPGEGTSSRGSGAGGWGRRNGGGEESEVSGEGEGDYGRGASERDGGGPWDSVSHQMDSEDTGPLASESAYSEEFDVLGVDEERPSSARAVPPVSPEASALETTRPKPVSTGFSNFTRPGEPLEESQPIAPSERYYFWLEVGEVKGAIDRDRIPLPVPLLPAEARLVVVIFAPDGGFRLKSGEDLGHLDLQADGGAHVARQPAKRHGNVDSGTLSRRLLFPLTAPAKRGHYRLRCNIYCHGVLVQSRIVDVEVGGINRETRVDYTLATKVDPAKLKTLAEHRFSILANHSSGDNHDLYIYGADGKKKAFRDSIKIPSKKLEGSLALARAALRRASWGDEDPWAKGKTYRYDGDPDIDRLHEDLVRLAVAGRRIYANVILWLAGGEEKRIEFNELVREPGLVQISTAADVGLVLPAALIYDYLIDTQGGAWTNYALCPEFVGAYEKGNALEETACFKGQCPNREQEKMVCPSGFWGFRHGLGLPISDIGGGNGGDGEFDLRLEYKDIPVIVVGVSRAHDLPGTGTHTKELEGLRPDWKSAWLVADELPPLLELMRSKEPHVVYMYCHGSGREVGTKEFAMLYLGENAQAAKPGEWLEAASLIGKIKWIKPRPLVFLNGCQTALLDEHTTLDFVEGFVQGSRACGLIGTEITVFEPLAGAFAKQFMTRFLGGAMVGQAIRDARLDLLREGNPLGLVYTPFVLAGTQLVRRQA